MRNSRLFEFWYELTNRAWCLETIENCEIFGIVLLLGSSSKSFDSIEDGISDFFKFNLFQQPLEEENIYDAYSPDRDR